MFAKLLKYEWKASAGLLGILTAAALGVGLVGGVALRYIFSLANTGNLDAASEVIVMPLTFLVLFMMLALVAYVFATQIILLSRFYKSRFTDEGYLTFTLPVTPTQSYLSALTNILIWNAISGLVMIVSLGALVLIGMSGIPGFEAGEVTDSISEGYRELLAMEGYLEYQLLSMVQGVVTFFSQPVLVMTCITLGAVLAKKHKILAAIGIYYGVSMAVSMLTSVGSAVVMLGELEAGASAYTGGAMLALVVQIVIQIGLCVGGSALSIWLMDKKLNLP